MNLSKICLLHRGRAKLDGEVKITKEEYQLACELEGKALATETLKVNVIAQLMFKYDQIPDTVEYIRNPLLSLCTKYGGKQVFCDKLGLTVKELSSMALKYKYPMSKHNKLLPIILSVVSEQDFCNYVYSEVYESYNNISEPFLGYKNTIPKRFYTWAQRKDIHQSRLVYKSRGMEVVSPVSIAEYITENMSDYSVMYKAYSNTLANFVYSTYGYRPTFIPRIKGVMNEGLKSKYKTIINACETLGVSQNTLYSLYNSNSLEPLGKFDHFIEEAGVHPIDFYYTAMLNKVDKLVRER